MAKRSFKEKKEIDFSVIDIPTDAVAWEVISPETKLSDLLKSYGREQYDGLLAITRLFNVLPNGEIQTYVRPFKN